jgi:chromosomal replication initiation ATPase DnaA
MSQISLPFEWQGQGEEFLVSEANQLAVAHLERWRDWPVSVTVLTGPPLSGRSALGRQFVAMSGGSVIDDAEGQDEHMLFHAWNEAQTEHRPLLMIGRTSPLRWTVALPDLRSRLAGSPHVAIEEPDEALARAPASRRTSPPGCSGGSSAAMARLRR